MNRKQFVLGLVLAAGAVFNPSFGQDAVTPAAAGPILKAGNRLAIAGDSITEQKLYSRFIETYLAVCTPELGIQAVQFGWGGDRAGAFVNRMDNDLLPFKPDVVTLCFGMNDGGYRAFEPSIGKAYEDPLRNIVSKLKKAGVIAVVGSPGAVDSKFFARGGAPDAAKVYNDNLAHLRDLAKQVAADNGMTFANVHDPLMRAMEKGKAALGENYDVCGRDGVHPGANGHLVMAYAFLKALGFTGDLGTITIDLKGTATATGGHQVLVFANGKADLESSRYPFCFSGDEKSSGGTRSILPYLPFNQELNRLTLVVKNVAGEKAKVTWGAASKEFSRADLEKGINLAAEFAETPFAVAFAKVDSAVAAKQAFETFMIKNFITFIPAIQHNLGQDQEAMAALNTVRTKMVAKHASLAAEVKASFAPVRHSLSVTAL